MTSTHARPLLAAVSCHKPAENQRGGHAAPTLLQAPCCHRSWPSFRVLHCWRTMTVSSPKRSVLQSAQHPAQQQLNPACFSTKSAAAALACVAASSCCWAQRVQGYYRQILQAAVRELQLSAVTSLVAACGSLVVSNSSSSSSTAMCGSIHLLSGTAGCKDTREGAVGEWQLTVSAVTGCLLSAGFRVYQQNR